MAARAKMAQKEGWFSRTGPKAIVVLLLAVILGVAYVHLQGQGIAPTAAGNWSLSGTLYECTVPVMPSGLLNATSHSINSLAEAGCPFSSIMNITNESASQNSSSGNGGQGALCPYGYKCGIAADGCAALGAVYNCLMIPANQTGNTTVAVDLQQELNNSAQAGFTLNQTVFYSNSSLQCSRQLISYCENNEPGQFICVNQNYSGLVSSQYNQTHKQGEACPMFLLAGSIGCSIKSDYCVVTRSPETT